MRNFFTAAQLGSWAIDAPGDPGLSQPSHGESGLQGNQYVRWKIRVVCGRVFGEIHTTRVTNVRMSKKVMLMSVTVILGDCRGATVASECVETLSINSDQV